MYKRNYIKITIIEWILCMTVGLIECITYKILPYKIWDRFIFKYTSKLDDYLMDKYIPDDIVFCGFNIKKGLYYITK